MQYMMPKSNSLIIGASLSEPRTSESNGGIFIYMYMWQSRVEIEAYSVAYFDRIAAFEAQNRWTSVKGGAHMHYVDLLDIHASEKRTYEPHP